MAKKEWNASVKTIVGGTKGAAVALEVPPQSHVSRRKTREKS